MSSTPRLLIAGVSEAVMKVAEGSLASTSRDLVLDGGAFFDKLEQLADGQYAAVLIGPCVTDVPALELAQSLRMQLPNTKIFYLCSFQESLPPADLVKNGCDDVFMFPLDERNYAKSMRSALSAYTQESHLTSVPAEDLAAGTQVDFDVSVFLPMNRKFVRVLKSGDAVRERTAQVGTELKQLFVDEKDLDRFVKYSREVHKADGGSRYETQLRRVQQVRQLYQELLMAAPTLNFDEGKRLLAKIKEIVDDVLLTAKTQSLKHEIVVGLNEGEFDLFERALRAARTAAVIATSTGHVDPADAATAAILMDLGLCVLPMNRDPNDRAEYERHPLESLRIVQERKIVLPTPVLDSIAQHHERRDGRGYPKKLEEFKITEGAEILYLVDRLLDLNLVSAGHKLRTAEEILNELSEDGGANLKLLKALRDQTVEAA